LSVIYYARERERDFFSLHCPVHTLVEVHPATYPQGAVSQGVKWPQGKAGHLPPSNANARPVFPTFLTCSWCSFKKIQRQTYLYCKGGISASYTYPTDTECRQILILPELDPTRYLYVYVTGIGSCLIFFNFLIDCPLWQFL